MNAKEIMEKHGLSTLCGFNPNPFEADFRDANLLGADLSLAKLQKANLSNATLYEANLNGAYLWGADLSDAAIIGANLYRADLSDANLQRANLTMANLHEAYLWGADLTGATYTIPQMLLADWGYVSDKLCLWLMRLDCSACRNGKARFERWITNNICPFSELDCEQPNIRRMANFIEKKSLWSFGPPPSMWTIWKRLCKEKDIKI